MTHFKLSLLASAAMGLVSIGSASALPLGSAPAAGENAAQNVRVVCDQWGRCYNTRHRGARHHHNGYYGYNNYSHNNGYYRSQRSYGYGPFGIFGN